MKIQELLKKALKQKATDIIIVSGSAPALRINGEIVLTEDDPLNEKTAEELIFSLLNPAQISIFKETRELDSAYELEGEARFRVNIHYEKGLPAAALRPIPTVIPTLEELRLPKAVEELSHEPRGLVLVTGPTGSGKTTTQACMIDIINNNYHRHILTIEDPIEYLHHDKKSIIEQREVGSDTLSFNLALKHVLRQNPDVILIGEMRDLETIQTAITAAETGHLVISTLHTGDSVQAIDRIIDVFPPHQQNQVRAQLAGSLKGVVAQQLLPRADGKGLVAAIEILKINAGIRNLIRKLQTHEIYSMIEINRKLGMQSMDSSLRELYEQKLISFDEMMIRAINPELLEKSIAR